VTAKGIFPHQESFRIGLNSCSCFIDQQGSSASLESAVNDMASLDIGKTVQKAEYVILIWPRCT